VPRYFVKLIFERPHSGLAMHKFQLAPGLVMSPSVVDNSFSNGGIDVAWDFQWQFGVVEFIRPGFLIESP
jgi:hypothetical protein